MTRTDVLNRFAQMYPDCDAPTAGLLFDESHKEICEELNARQSTLAISLTAGTREYALSATTQKVTEAYYQVSSTESSWYKIEPVSIEQLAERGNWRAQAQQVIPTEYYITPNASSNTSVLNIGFVQIPPTTTSASYPNVTLYGSFIVDLVGGDNLPVAISYTDIYPYTMAKKFSVIKVQGMETTLYWKRLADEEMQKNKESIKGSQFGNEGVFLIPSFVHTQTRGR